jgi:hypothetical protein
MNESISILLATTILALGGLGLYLYKSSDGNTKVEKDEDEYDEDTLFGGSFWGSSDDKEKDDSENLEETEIYEEEFKPRKRGNKTQRNRKTSSTSRRRY